MKHMFVSLILLLLGGLASISIAQETYSSYSSIFFISEDGVVNSEYVYHYDDGSQDPQVSITQTLSGVLYIELLWGDGRITNGWWHDIHGSIQFTSPALFNNAITSPEECDGVVVEEGENIGCRTFAPEPVPAILARISVVQSAYYPIEENADGFYLMPYSTTDIGHLYYIRYFEMLNAAYIAYGDIEGNIHIRGEQSLWRVPQANFNQTTNFLTLPANWCLEWEVVAGFAHCPEYPQETELLRLNIVTSNTHALIHYKYGGFGTEESYFNIVWNEAGELQSFIIENSPPDSIGNNDRAEGKFYSTEEGWFVHSSSREDCLIITHDNMTLDDGTNVFPDELSPSETQVAIHYINYETGQSWNEIHSVPYGQYECILGQQTLVARFEATWIEWSPSGSSMAFWEEYPDGRKVILASNSQHSFIFSSQNLTSWVWEGEDRLIIAQEYEGLIFLASKSVRIHSLDLNTGISIEFSIPQP